MHNGVQMAENKKTLKQYGVVEDDIVLIRKTAPAPVTGGTGVAAGAQVPRIRYVAFLFLSLFWLSSFCNVTASP